MNYTCNPSCVGNISHECIRRTEAANFCYNKQMDEVVWHSCFENCVSLGNEKIIFHRCSVVLSFRKEHHASTNYPKDTLFQQSPYFRTYILIYFYISTYVEHITCQIHTQA